MPFRNNESGGTFRLAFLCQEEINIPHETCTGRMRMFILQPYISSINMVSMVEEIYINSFYIIAQRIK